MKKWREQHINRHLGIFFRIGFGVIIVVLIAIGVSGFHAIKNIEKATIGKIDELQSLVSDTIVNNRAGPVFRKYIAEEKPNMETRLAQLEADNKNLSRPSRNQTGDFERAPPSAVRAI